MNHTAGLTQSGEMAPRPSPMNGPADVTDHLDVGRGWGRSAPLAPKRLRAETTIIWWVENGWSGADPANRSLRESAHAHSHRCGKDGRDKDTHRSESH